MMATISKTSLEEYTLVNREEGTALSPVPELNEIIRKTEVLYGRVLESRNGLRDLHDSIDFYARRPHLDVRNRREFYVNISERLEAIVKNVSQAQKEFLPLREAFFQYDLIHQISAKSSKDYVQAERFAEWAKMLQDESISHEASGLKKSTDKTIDHLDWKVEHSHFEGECALV